MNTTQAIRARRSIRKYKRGAAVPQEHIDLMLEAAMCAPSAMNKRAYSFIVVENTDLKNRIADVHPYAKFLKNAPLCVVVCGEKESAFFPQDCSAAIENLLLQATELGYGSCWAAIYPHEGRMNDFQRLIELGDAVPFALVTIGEADEAPGRRGFYDRSKVRVIR